MIESLLLLLALQFAGEALAGGLGLPIPGPVLGMIALWVWLARGGKVPVALERTATGVLDNLSLLFVPAAAGLMLHTQRLAAEGAGVLAAVVLSTLAGMAATALVMSRFPPGDAP